MMSEFVQDDGGQITGDMSPITNELAILRIVEGGMPENRPVEFDNVSDYAATVERHEVVRDPDQLDEISREYAEGNIEARKILLKHLDINKFRPNDFPHSFRFRVLDALEEAHAVLGPYHDIYGKRIKRSGAPELRGREVRDELDVLVSYRRSQAEEVAKLAIRARDPYKDRFRKSHHGVVMYPKLENIPDSQLPTDIVTGDDFREYRLQYPAGAYVLENYFRQVDIKHDDIKGKAYEHSSHETRRQQRPISVLGALAEQYQLLACIREFQGANNSLHMNLVNMYLKTMGLRGISHGNLDLVAQRFQPASFKRHFIRQVISQQVITG
jgi:hypothetical protein